MSTHTLATPALPPVPGEAVSLLQTKLNVPRTGSALVARARLTDRLGAGADGRLTILSAPAGFGKTTLVGQWLAADPALGRRAAWVSLDPSENDPTLFWSYVVAALQGVHPGMGAEALRLLSGGRGGSVQPALIALLNEIAALDPGAVLVLDDYHVIETPAIHDAVAFLIDHLPRRMHVVIATRFDPPLPLARLRARGEMTELRVPELRFSREETSAFLKDVMALDLPESRVSELKDRTEGWITALKLTAMAGLSGATPDGAAFRSGNGFVADYVVEEVLRAEPEAIRRFLLATSVLRRLTAPLCVDVAEEPDAGRLLLDVARRNLFVVALDEGGTWFRYHHLFAEALQGAARRTDPELLRASHLRASRWYEEHGFRLEAVDHAVGAGDDDRVADLLEAEWPEKNQSWRSLRWLRHAKTLPADAFADRPVLSMGFAWALLNNGEPEGAEIPLRRVEEWLGSAAPDDRPHADGSTAPRSPHSRQLLSAELAAARAYLAQMLGDADTTIAHARRSLELSPESDHAGRATGTALVALAAWGSGRLDEAYETFEAALASMRRAGRRHDVVRGAFVLGDLRVAQGRLRDAAALYEDGLRQAAEYAGSLGPAGHGEGAPSVESDELYLGLAEVHCEWGDLDAAERFLARLEGTRATATHAGNPQRWLTAAARLRAARGDAEGALTLLDRAQSLRVETPIPQVQPVAAMKARLHVAMGRLAEARLWIAGAGLTADDLTYPREFEQLTRARVLLAEARQGAPGALDDAARLLGRLVEDAGVGGRRGSLVEAVALLAIARSAAGDRRGAMDSIARALELAEAEGFVRVFIDEGTPMRDLLRQAIARRVSSAHAQRLLAAMDTGRPGAPDGEPAKSPARLTSREEVILRLLATGLRNQEIAEHLFISPATVKRHVANIYLKLDVTHRTAALARASELKLL